MPGFLPCLRNQECSLAESCHFVDIQVKDLAPGRCGGAHMKHSLANHFHNRRVHSTRPCLQTTHAQRGLENKRLSRLSSVSPQSPNKSPRSPHNSTGHRGIRHPSGSLAIKDVFLCLLWFDFGLVDWLVGWCWGPHHANSVSEPHLQPSFCSRKPTVSILSSLSHPHSGFQHLSQNDRAVSHYIH